MRYGKKDVAVHRLVKSHSLKRSQEAIGEGIDSVATDTQCAGDTRTLVSSSRTAMNVEKKEPKCLRPAVWAVSGRAGSRIAQITSIPEDC